jgi:hypothetical protein
MRVAFVHYHLKPGGVTTVIRQQVETLREVGGEAMVLAGKSAPDSFPAETVYIPGLGYNRDISAGPPGETVAETIAEAITKRWPGGCDVIHVHNPTLAKNIHFPTILGAIQKKGFRLLLQIHDFAEDGRPDAYFKAPYQRDCHYAVLNSRDYRILLSAGLKKKGLHLLPNMVSPLETVSDERPAAPVILYPVRAIRRKNIGEALLLSLFFQTGRYLAVTLPPNSPADMVAYEDWKLFVKKHHLPVRFEVGLHNDFSKQVAMADCFITTSITEGFGFSFLEPWTAGKALQGRKLPDICSDFEAKGIDLNELYPRILIPMDWFDRKDFLHIWRNTLETTCHRFAYSIPSSAVLENQNRLTHATDIDFGLLNEKYQKEVLRHLQKHPGEKAVLKRLNPFLENLSDLPSPKDLVRRNRKAVLTEFGVDIYRNILKNVYKQVVSETVSHEIQKDVLLARFLDLERLSLLKWGNYER